MEVGEEKCQAGTDSNSNIAKTNMVEMDVVEEVAEQVVEEGQIVMQQVEVEDPSVSVDGGQVVMMTNSGGLQQQIMITDSGMGGTQVIQIHPGNQGVFMDSRNLKTEPEDLSVTVTRETAKTITANPLRHVNMEAGAQAIQASAAAAVQNVIRSLKEQDKNILNQILPHHMILDHDTGQRIQTSTGEVMVVEDQGRPDSGLGETIEAVNGSTSTPPAKRSRNHQQESPRVQIAKQYTPFGFHCILEAPTAQWVRRDEDRCTYLNKGQFYGVTLEYRSNPSEPVPGDLQQVKSIIMCVFREAKNPEDEISAWDFWHQRQPTSKQRIIDAETNNMSEQCGVSHIEDVAYNAIAVYWNPLEKPAFISIAIQCLSTDFSLQKGVKGLPLHLQVDTYIKNPSDGEYDIVHRGYCQLKVFCDKGAERKFRQEERRAARKVAVGGQRVLDMYHQCQERSEFYSMVDMSRLPVMYTPSSSPSPVTPGQALIGGVVPPPTGASPGPGLSLLKQNGAVGPEVKRRKTFPPPETRMVVYVRQENEEIFTPLHLVPPTVPGLARAIETKYNVSATAIRYLYRRNKKGITAKLDDDLLKFYCNEDTFLMQVTAIELEGVEGHESIMYDITLCELAD